MVVALLGGLVVCRADDAIVDAVLLLVLLLKEPCFGTCVCVCVCVC